MVRHIFGVFSVGVLLLVVVSADPTGESWEQIEGITARVCDLYDDRYMWCIDEEHEIYKITLGTNKYELIDGEMDYISAGQAGVWATDYEYAIYFRKGSYNSAQGPGYSWERVPGSLKKVAVGEDLVAGTDDEDNIYIRKGISECNHIGERWVHLSGSCKQVDIFGDNDLWCVNDNDEIYKFEWASNQWSVIDGTMAFLSVGPAGVYGVNSESKIMHRLGTYGNTHSEGSEWTELPGQLKTVSTGKSIIIGTSMENTVYIKRGITRENQVGEGGWRYMTYFPQKQCATHTDYTAWCVDPDGKVRHFEFGYDSWEDIDGTLRQVDVGTSGVWGVNKDGDVFYRTGTYGNPNVIGTGWEQIDSGEVKMHQISVGNNLVVAVSKDQKPYFRHGISCDYPNGTEWTLIPGTVYECGLWGHKQTVWCVQDTGKVWKYRPGQNNWKQISGTLSYVTNGYNGVWGVQSSGNIFYREDTSADPTYAGSGWVRVSGSLASISVGNMAVIGVDDDNELYIRRGITHE